MSVAKIAISLDQGTLQKLDRLVQRGVYPSRSRAVQAAIEAQLTRLERGRLARECAKLDPVSEAAMADEGLAADLSEWPEY